MAPAVRASEHHVGHHMVESEPEKWLLVSTDKNAAAAEEAAPMVQELVTPMIEQFGMTLEVLTAGDVLRTV